MIKLTLFLFLAITALANCPSNSVISGLETGSLELQSFTTNNIFTHNFERRFTNTPTIAIGILDLEFNGSNDPNLNHFNVRATSMNPSQATIGLQPSRSGSWEKIKIKFWANQRDDLVMGSAYTNLGSLQGSSVTKSVTTKNIPNYQMSILRPFINGVSFHSGSTELDIHIDGRQINQNRISISIIVGPNSNVKEVWMSYVIFSPQAIPFASYGGLTAEIGFQGIVHTNVHTIIHQTNYILAGISKFKSALNEPFTFTSGIDEDFILTYEAKGNTVDFFITYLVFGMAPGKLCSDCTDKLAYNSRCVRTCPIDSYPFTYRDQGRGCMKCSAKINEYLNADRSGCVKGNGPVSPTSPPTSTQTTSPTSISPPPQKTVDPQERCKSQLNTYWTGYRCACRVGYRASVESGTCEKIVITFPKPKVVRPKCSTTQFFNGKTCECLPKHTRKNGICVIDIPVVPCPEFSARINGVCVCASGYKLSNIGKCTKICPQDMVSGINNQCVCKPGTYMDPQTNKCVLGKPCPANSFKNANGKCECVAGYHMNSGSCTRCPAGQVWDGQSSCVYPCGINQQYNPFSARCECLEGYGVLDGICSICSGEYFLLSGYCVTCPINTVNNNGECNCKAGYEKSAAGVCTKSCSGQNEYYDSISGKCKCYEGLGRINGKCQVCPGGFSPNSAGDCSGCGANERFMNGACSCISGYGIDASGSCIKCESKDLILIQGICGTCPVKRIWNGQTCQCVAGTEEVNGFCTEKCKPNQLIDAFGGCYYCPINEFASNGACECQSGYVRNPSNRICELKCEPNQHVINGICASCSLNSVFDPELNSCICPEGYYRNNFKFCEKHIPTPVSCESGSYFEENEGCKSCPIGCSSCENRNKCTACHGIGYIPSGGSCVPECGDGIIIRETETCDDGNKGSGDGCSSSCQQQTNYVCSGSPSNCVNVAPTPPPSSNCGNSKLDSGETCDDGNDGNGDGCSSSCKTESGYDCGTTVPSVCLRQPLNIVKVGNVINNSAAVYITVKTTPTFIFDSKDEMRNFFSYEFSNNAQPSSAYCYQKFGNPAFFDCVFYYPSGVPNVPFSIILTFDKDGKSGYLGIPVDTSKSVFALRSLN